jgi:hypothetical protein
MFYGVSLSDIPAALLLTNYIAETGDRAQQCLEAAAGAVVHRDGNPSGAAECSAVLCAVEGLLQLSAQPVARQLLTPHQLQELTPALMSCKQQLIDTIAGICQTLYT